MTAPRDAFVTETPSEWPRDKPLPRFSTPNRSPAPRLYHTLNDYSAPRGVAHKHTLAAIGARFALARMRVRDRGPVKCPEPPPGFPSPPGAPAPRFQHTLNDFSAPQGVAYVRALIQNRTSPQDAPGSRPKCAQRMAGATVSE